MIVVAIIAILAAIAVPIYRDYVIRARLSDGQSQLSASRTMLEQYYQDNRNYGPASAACAAALPSSVNFTFTCTTTADAQGFTLTAAGKTGTVVDGFSYTVDQTNARATTNVPAKWAKSTTCWTIRKDGSCS